MLIKTKTTIGNGPRIELDGAKDLLVREGVRVVSLSDDAVIGDGAGIEVAVEGLVQAGDDAIFLNGPRARVVVGKTGAVFAQETCVVLQGAEAVLINRGLISGDDAAVEFQGAGIGNRSRMVNEGVIASSDLGIHINGSGDSLIRNEGRIVIGTLGNFAFLGNGGQDVILNSGRIEGDVILQFGNDIYDGRGGRIIGQITGGGGDDTFRLSNRFAETVSGGSGIDTLDFRGNVAVRVNLNETVQGGAAAGDAYSEIERIQGSSRNDRLTGDGLDSIFVGNGGNDKLFGGLGLDRLSGGKGNDLLDGGNDAYVRLGGAGNDILPGGDGEDTRAGGGGTDSLDGGNGADRLSGGAGIDTLTGGVGNDSFVFAAPDEAGDAIADFTFAIDRIAISAAGFRGGLQAGVLGEDQFVVAVNRQAVDADDRFIFRTTDKTLWFDRDGTGTRFAPVLVADLQEGAVIQAGQIEIF